MVDLILLCVDYVCLIKINRIADKKEFSYDFGNIYVVCMKCNVIAQIMKYFDRIYPIIYYMVPQPLLNTLSQ